MLLDYFITQISKKILCLLPYEQNDVEGPHRVGSKSLAVADVA